ncbi:MAG: SMI1/KNR4 family protein [Verrucomicrobia bacterium]|nr:SMI1/KNR4 family protein [Verrucomicrobiota bacterium]
MSLQALEQFAKSPAPGFRCFASGDESGSRFLASVRHILNPPGSSASIAQIRETLGSHAAQVADFYQHHDGFILYRDTKSDAAGIELLSVEQWVEATDDMRDWFDLTPEEDPDHIVTGISIATVPHSGNYFVMPIEGPSAGKIFYADHDGWYEAAFADDFTGFLARVTREPVKLLTEDVGCYTRYSDGTSDSQWIPEEYFSDISKVQL